MTREIDETLPDLPGMSGVVEAAAAPAQPAGPKAGDRIAGRFLLSKELGRGAMGTVWRARHEGLEIDVALKLISPEIRERRNILDRFYREAKTLAKINHPNVVRVLDVALPEDPVPYLAMELLDGVDLRQYIDRKGALEPREAIEIVSKLVEGLAAAHGADVVHRDLKPANVFLAHDKTSDLGFRVVVVDFGTALLLDGLDNRLTQAGIVVGTPLYMSPEQAVGDVPAAASDLYAAAVILYELLSEHVPHEVDDFRALLSRRSTQEAAPIRELRPELPGSYDAFFRSALAVDRRERFEGATDFRKALEPLLERQGSNFDSDGFSNALDAAVGKSPATPPPAPRNLGLDLVAPTQVSGPGTNPDPGQAPIGQAILKPGEAIGEPGPAASSLPGIELDYEAAGLEPPEPEKPVAPPVRPGRGLVRNLASLLIASLVAYFAWVLLGGDAAFADFEQGPMLEAAFTWVAAFIMAVVVFSRAAHTPAPASALVQAGDASDAGSDSPAAN